MRLGVNIDHVATLRQQRFTTYPDPVAAAQDAEQGGADLITVHLREDRRHIQDRDVERLRESISVPLNLEMAATEEMVKIARKIRPAIVCLVPERRQELTTEGGLDVESQVQSLSKIVSLLQDDCIPVSLFINADKKQIDAAREINVFAIELHTGTYAESLSLRGDNIPSLRGAPHASNLSLRGAPEGRDVAISPFQNRDSELHRLIDAAKYGASLGLHVHAGHGLDYQNVKPIVKIPHIEELNIGHSIIGRAIFIGLEQAVRDMAALLRGTQ